MLTEQIANIIKQIMAKMSRFEKVEMTVNGRVYTEPQGTCGDHGCLVGENHPMSQAPDAIDKILAELHIDGDHCDIELRLADPLPAPYMNMRDQWHDKILNLEWDDIGSVVIKTMYYDTDETTAGSLYVHFNIESMHCNEESIFEGISHIFNGHYHHN